MNNKIDINLADADTLTTIAGIGPALAQRIVEYRETVHPFEEVIELAAVPGISEKMVRSFEDAVTVASFSQVTAVPLQPDEPEDMLLLEAPEPVALLTTPEPPADEDVEMVETPVEADDPIDEIEEAAVVTETAVPQPDSPVIEEIPLAEPRFAMPDPDLMATAPAQPPVDWNAKAQRRGCISTLLGATFGAILGAVLTLALLAALNNGSLTYSESDTAIRRQLDTEIISRTNELNQLSTRVSLVATSEAEANQMLESDLAAANEALNEELANNGQIISYLATRSGDLELRLQDVAGAADTFTGFLDGLRFLLDDLDGTTATATPSAVDVTSSPTPTPFASGTAQPEPTTAVPPTRTPQPTATPFTFPTNTPAPQP